MSVQPGLTPIAPYVETALPKMGFGDHTIADMLSRRTKAMARHCSKRKQTRKSTALVKYFEADRWRTKTVRPG